MSTFDLLFAIFGESHEYVEALVTAVADKVIGGHALILMESRPGVERNEHPVLHKIALELSK
ncbi:MAG TPA: hypothetical protein VFY25_11970 [Anaerolineales bacterium]|nr:hypothetical protein [Anaerolineales bacterium]